MTKPRARGPVEGTAVRDSSRHRDLFADLTYVGGPSIMAPFLAQLGATDAVTSIVSGAGEFVGCTLRAFSGYTADKTRRYWTFVVSRRDEWNGERHAIAAMRPEHRRDGQKRNRPTASGVETAEKAALRWRIRPSAPDYDIGPRPLALGFSNRPRVMDSISGAA
jgi:hypothetical protein